MISVIGQHFPNLMGQLLRRKHLKPVPPVQLMKHGMIRSLLLFSFFSLFLGQAAWSQCDIPPSTDNCENAPILCNFDDIDGYCTSMDPAQTFNGPTPLCNNGGGGVPNNPIWFGFYAGCNSITVNITPSNCVGVGGTNGIQAAIYGYGGTGECPSSNATPAEYVACSGDCPQTNNIQLVANGLNIGQAYYFFIDGCAGSYCDISVDILGSCGEPGIDPWPGPIQGPTYVCSGSTGTYTINPPQGATEYYWYLDGINILTGTDEFIDIDWSAAGTYQLCVDAGNLCVSEFEDPAQICIDIEVYDVTPENPDPVTICEGDTYTYPGDNNDYGPGVYDITLTSPEGCDSTITLEVMADPLEEVQIGPFYLCEGDIIEVGGQQWDSNNQGSNEVVIPQQEAPFCDSTIQFDIIFMSADVFIFDPLPLGCDITEVELDGSGSLADPPGLQVNYTWTALDGGILGDPFDEPAMTVLDTGKYCLTIEIIALDGSNSCTDSACVVVTQVDVPEAVANGDTITCVDPIADLIGSSGTPNVCYEWLDPNGNSIYQDCNDPNTTTTVPGIYTFVVTDNTGCSSTVEVEIVPNDNLPDVQTLDDSITCDQPTATLEGSSNEPGVIYTWTNSAGDTIGNQPIIPAPGPGTFTLTVLAPNGCSNSEVAVVSEDILGPTPTASTDTLTCNLPDPPLNGGSNLPNATYMWSGPGGFMANIPDTFATVSGSYTLTVTNPDNGCTSDTTIVVPEDTALPQLSAAGDSIDCIKTVGTLVGNSNTPGATYEWLDPAGASIANTASVSASVPGIYTLIVTGLNGCTDQTTAELILDAEIPTINVAQTDDTIDCNVTSITLTGSSNLTVVYEWTDAGGTVLGSDPELVVTTGGSYTLVVTSGNGCTNEETVIIGEDLAPPVIDNVAGGEIDCLTGVTTLSASSSTPGATFQWFNDGGVPTDPGPNPDVNEAGVYTLVLTGLNGCTATADATVTLSVDAPQNPDATNDGPITCTQGTVNLNATSSTAGVSYSWNGPSGTNNGQSYNTNLPGTYSVTITNPSNGCTVVQSTQVAIDTVSPVMTPDGNLIDCYNPTVDISVDVNPAGATVNWTDPSGNPAGNTPVINVGVSGTYQVVATDPVNGCTSTTDVIVDENTTQPDLAPLQAPPLTCVDPTITIDATSQTTVNYLWTGPDITTGNETDEDPAVTQPGNYTVVITDPINGCTNTANITVTEDKVDPQVDVAGGIIDCNQGSITLNGTTVPNSNITVEWQLDGTSLPDNTANITVSQPGTYTLIVTNNQNGCVGQDTALVVLDDDTPNVDATGGTITCLDPEVILIGSSTTPGVTYLWTGPGFSSTNPVDTTTVAGSYTLTVTAPNGCTNSITVEVLEDTDFPTAVAASSNLIDCTNLSTTLSANGSSTGADFTYSWTDPLGVFVSSAATIPNVTLPGTYTLAVTNVTNGCIATTTVEVEENTNRPTAIDVELANPRCFGFQDGFITVTGVTGGTPDYLYSVNGGPFTPNPQFSGLGDGTYTITIQDAAGCLYTAPDIDLTEPEELLVELGEDFILQWGNDTFLYALITPPDRQIQSINWTPTGVDTTGFSQEILIKPFNQTLYGVTVIDSAGCTAEDKVLVLVEKRRPVYIPNVFAPDGEQNTRFYIQAGDGIEEIEVFEVFNRWGERVFVNENFLPNDPSEGWDGNFRSRPANPEVFVYYAKIRFQDGITILYKGDVTLLR